MNFEINNLIRKNIQEIIIANKQEDNYEIKFRLDKNENSLGSPLPKWYNRYPDFYQKTLKENIANIKNTNAENIFLGNGTEECIDVLYKCFCEPEKDNVIVCPPTDNRYEFAAKIANVEVKEAVLLDDFQLDLVHLENLIDEHTKIIWIASPNNPTGNSMNRNDIELLLNNFNGLVVIDEAYINFSRQKSFIQLLIDYPNLIILQTFSKAWGLAGLRLSALFANANIINALTVIKKPYNINTATQELVLKALEEIGQVNGMIKLLVEMRQALIEVFKEISFIEKVYESDANFILIKVHDAADLYQYLLSKSIAVENVSHLPLCENCLRITVGTEQENTILIDAFADYLERF